MKKRPRAPRSSASRDQVLNARLPGAGRAPSIRAPGFLQYKVVELSTVDESSLQEAINTWVAQGWSLDGIQFAMREASKRPAMAFIFFTRDGESLEERDPHEARAKLRRIAHAADPQQPRAVSAYERLVQLASDDEAESDE